MTKVLVVVRDVKSGYMDVRSCDTKEQAIRDFCTLFHPGERTMLAMYPADFSLCYVGEYDSKTCVITPCDHEVLISGIDAANHWRAQEGGNNEIL